MNRLYIKVKLCPSLLLHVIHLRWCWVPFTLRYPCGSDSEPFVSCWLSTMYTIWNWHYQCSHAYHMLLKKPGHINLRIWIQTADVRAVEDRMVQTDRQTPGVELGGVPAVSLGLNTNTADATVTGQRHISGTAPANTNFSPQMEIIVPGR